MALFVVTAADRPGSLDLRTAERPAHRAYLAEQAAILKIAGPLLDDEGAMCGSLFIVDVADRAAAEAFSAGDPFSKIGLFERVEIRPWLLTVGGFA
jgi:uncharacterized protein YciI